MCGCVLGRSFSFPSLVHYYFPTTPTITTTTTTTTTALFLLGIGFDSSSKNNKNNPVGLRHHHQRLTSTSGGRGWYSPTNHNKNWGLVPFVPFHCSSPSPSPSPSPTTRTPATTTTTTARRFQSKTTATTNHNNNNSNNNTTAYQSPSTTTTTTTMNTSQEKTTENAPTPVDPDTKSDHKNDNHKNHQPPSGDGSDHDTHPNKNNSNNDSDKNNKNNKNDVEEVTQALDKVHLTTTKDHPRPTAEIPKSLQTLASWFQNGSIKNILVVTGAGISVSAGIPDFRTPGTGLYDNLQKYNLPFPEAVFDLLFFADTPKPFLTLAKELWPTGETFQPTITHAFLTLLARKQLLLRVYSQNIDGLEHLAQLPTDKLIECHGHFRTASCIRCKRPAPDMEQVKETILKKAQVPLCGHCGDGYIKPDIVFFGEGLPDRFFQHLSKDLNQADCCIVLGTSLQVAPVSMIPDKVRWNCKRVLLNRDHVGSFDDNKNNSNDLYHLGDCDESIRLLATALGWRDELEQLHSQIISNNHNTKTNETTQK